MTRPVFRFADLIGYDVEQGTIVLLAWDAHRGSHRRHILTTAAGVAALLAGHMIGSAGAPFAAAYAVALVCRSAQNAPIATTLTTLQLLAAQLHPMLPYHRQHLFEQAVTVADAALRSGTSGELAVVTLLAAASKQIGRSSGRAGQRAAELLDPADTALLVPYDALALLTTVTAMPDPATWLIAADPTSTDARLIAAIAGNASIIPPQTAVERLQQQAIDLVIIETAAVQRDGAAEIPTAAVPVVTAAHAAGVACYAIAADGPASPAPGNQRANAGQHLVATAAISAIITSRGIYRPAMIMRHHDDADMPHEPLIELLP